MKNCFLLLIPMLFFVYSCEEKIDAGKEKAAIMAVMEEETAAYCADDTSRWAATYAQDSTMMGFNIWNNGYGMSSGWESYAASVESTFPGKKTENTEIKTPVMLKVYEESAWVVFKNKSPDNEAFVTCFLEKKAGTWKIVYRGVLWSQTYYDVDYFLINSINHAKSMGQSVEKFAEFTGNQFKTGWNKEMGLNGFINGVQNNWGSIVRIENMKVEEKDGNHCVLHFTKILPNLQKNGPLFNVSYDDYLTFYRVTFEVVADYLGLVYTQETIPDGVKITITKK